MQTPNGAERAAADLAMAYLAAMEARELDRARAMLAPDFGMQFPGTGTMTRLEDLIDWARPRYRGVHKTTGAVECLAADGAIVVYVRGTLAGEWPDGTPFEGIRFIDRFEVAPDQAGGPARIRRIDVWNDIAEVRAA